MIMLLQGVKAGFALTGSFCTLENAVRELGKMVAEGADVTPIISAVVDSFDTRFGRAEDWKNKIESITGKKIIKTIVDAEPIGPKAMFDIIVVVPCTGNTLGKLANGITDTSVTMACKAQIRNGRPVVLSIATNDGLGANARNLGTMLNTKNIYFVPFGQDDPVKKCNSLIANTELVIPTVLEALKGKQLQPILIA